MNLHKILDKIDEYFGKEIQFSVTFQRWIAVAGALIAILIICFSTCSKAHADERHIPFDVQIYAGVMNDAENIAQDAAGCKIRAYFNDLNNYIFVGRENVEMRFGGQSGFNLPIWYAGIGARMKFTENFYLSFDGGWYAPLNKDEQYDASKTTIGEGLQYEMHKIVNDGYWWDYYTIEYQGAPGLTIALDYSKQLSTRWSIGLTAGYRYLRMNEKIKGKPYDYAAVQGFWEVKQKRDFSMAMIAATLEIVF